jgi:hypothetical protein
MCDTALSCRLYLGCIHVIVWDAIMNSRYPSRKKTATVQGLEKTSRKRIRTRVWQMYEKHHRDGCQCRTKRVVACSFFMTVESCFPILVAEMGLKAAREEYRQQNTPLLLFWADQQQNPRTSSSSSCEAHCEPSMPLDQQLGVANVTQVCMHTEAYPNRTTVDCLSSVSGSKLH